MAEAKERRDTLRMPVEQVAELAEQYLQHQCKETKVYKVEEIPGGWYIEHDTPGEEARMRIHWPRIMIMNRWTGEITEVSSPFPKDVVIMDFITYLPEDQKKLALEEMDLFPYFPVRYSPYQIRLFDVGVKALDYLLFEAEFDLNPLREHGVVRAEAVEFTFRVMGLIQSVDLLESTLRQDRMRNRYKAHCDFEYLTRLASIGNQGEFHANLFPQIAVDGVDLDARIHKLYRQNYYTITGFFDEAARQYFRKSIRNGQEPA